MKKLLGALSVLALIFCNINGAAAAKKAKKKSSAHAGLALQKAVDAVLANVSAPAAAVPAGPVAPMPATAAQAPDVAQTVAVLQSSPKAGQQAAANIPPATAVAHAKTAAALAVTAKPINDLANYANLGQQAVANATNITQAVSALQSQPQVGSQQAATNTLPVATVGAAQVGSANAIAAQPNATTKNTGAKLSTATHVTDDEKAPEQPRHGFLSTLAASVYTFASTTVSGKLYSHRSIVTAALQDGTFTQKYPKLADQLAAMNLALSDVIEKTKNPAQHREHNRLKEMLYLVQQSKKYKLALPPQYKEQLKEILAEQSNDLERLRELVKTPPPAATTQPDKPQQPS